MKYKKKKLNIFILFCCTLFLVVIAYNPQSIEKTNNGSRTINTSVYNSNITNINNAPVKFMPSITSISNINSSIKPASGLVNPYRLYKSEPAPMGLADFGINPKTNKSYNYSTTSFLEIAKIYSLTATGGTINGSVSLQLNTMLKFMVGSSVYVYYLQNIAFIDSISKTFYFVDNIWNMSSYKAQLSYSGMFGYGAIFNYNSNIFYYFFDQLFLTETYPNTIQLKTTSSIGENSEPIITFSFNNGNGNWTTYDRVSFLKSVESINDMNLTVDGSQYAPSYNYLDAEFVLGGSGGGSIATIQNSTKLDLQLEYYNGSSFQPVPYAYNFGGNTQEKVNNVNVKYYANTNNSTSYVELTQGLEKFLGPVIYLQDRPNPLFTLELIGIVVIASIVFFEIYFSSKNKKKRERMKKVK